MEFIDIVPGRFYATVDSHPVPHLILYNEHSKLFQLFSKLLDIKTDNPVIQFYVGLVIKHLQRSVDIDFQSCGNPLCLWFFLFAETIIQISQDWHIFRFRIRKIILIYKRKASVNDRLFFCFNSIPASHDQFTKG